MTKKRNKKVHYIKWIDSGIAIINRWQDIADLKDNLRDYQKTAESVGFLIKEDEDWVVLATTWHNDEIICGQAVYKKNIIERRVLN
jgi:hypothetical protein